MQRLSRQHSEVGLSGVDAVDTPHADSQLLDSLVVRLERMVTDRGMLKPHENTAKNISWRSWWSNLVAACLALVVWCYDRLSKTSVLPYDSALDTPYLWS